MEERVKIVVTVPLTHAAQLRERIGSAGAGRIGAYSFCSFSIQGIGRFRPDAHASPAIGSKEILEEVVEERIEVQCNKENTKEIVDLIRKYHPYEEPCIDVYSLLSFPK